MAFYVAAGAFVVLRFLAENPAVTLALADEVALLRQRLSTRPAWANGPHLELDEARCCAALRVRVMSWALPAGGRAARAHERPQ
jgi:hypothetical protein